MLRSTCQRLLAATSRLAVPRASHKYYVINEALAQLERDCEQCWPPPRDPPRKVTIIGAGSDVGRIVCLLLKQQNVIKTLAMYDDVPERQVVGVATDLAHIDTSTAVEAYQGRAYLKSALDNTDVVLICGGCYTTPPNCFILDRDLFMKNLQYVRTTAMACAHFCPHAVIAVQTPPVDCNFALVKHTLKLNRVYDKRRLLGLNAISSMRANQLCADAVKSEPQDSYVPIMGGTCRCTRVPIFSNTKNFFCITPEQMDLMLRLVRDADDLICRVKSNCEQGHLSLGFSTARFVVNIMKGLFEKPAFIDSALVDQGDPAACYNMETCASPVTVGKGGITAYEIPKMSDTEKGVLEGAKCDLEDMLNLGRCYAVGEEYFMHDCKFYQPYVPPPCPVCRVCGK